MPKVSSLGNPKPGEREGRQGEGSRLPGRNETVAVPYGAAIVTDGVAAISNGAVVTLITLYLYAWTV